MLSQGFLRESQKEVSKVGLEVFFNSGCVQVVSEHSNIESAKPKYPEAAKKEGFKGTVTVMIVIDETGKVERVWVSESDDPILDDAAIAAAYRFRFTPAISKGVPVKQRD